MVKCTPSISKGSRKFFRTLQENGNLGRYVLTGFNSTINYLRYSFANINAIFANYVVNGSAETTFYEL